jgi:hypothetical protein
VASTDCETTARLRGRAVADIKGAIPMSDKESHGARSRRVERKIPTARDSPPGERNDLPAGALDGLPAEPQGDENREPPPGATAIPR